MNILFLTLTNINSCVSHGIYQDLMREFARNNNQVFIVSPSERRNDCHTRVIEEKGDVFPRIQILKVKTGNIQKTNIIEKGISTVMIEYQILSAIKKYYKNVKFDLVLYSTPPITLIKPIEYIKKRDGARAYLMLKDIFPQNAVDMCMLSKKGVKGILYKNFRKKEIKLYEISDMIGCMSPANVDYITKHNPEVDRHKVEVCPNSIEMQEILITTEEKIAVRNKYGIPLHLKVFIYGGNLGKPQGIPFLIECLRYERNNAQAFFLIVGAGTEYEKLANFIQEEKLSNVRILKYLPKHDYMKLVAACDVGMIFLDHRFTIPNFPSRILSYMQVGLPILACTDPNTDVGNIIVEGKFGWWCESNDIIDFARQVKAAISADCVKMGANGLAFLKEHFTVDKTYQAITAER